MIRDLASIPGMTQVTGDSQTGLLGFWKYTNPQTGWSYAFLNAGKLNQFLENPDQFERLARVKERQTAVRALQKPSGALTKMLQILRG